MRYHIVYKCGHEENVNLNGRQNSQSYADWLAAGVCKECYQAQKLADRKAYNAAEGLPELTGTERQVAWADKIRYELYREIKNILNVYYEDEGKEELLNWLKGQAEAKFWIDNKDKKPEEIIYYWQTEVMGYGK